MTIRIEHPKERRLYYPHITKCGRPFLICYAAKETAPARQLHSEALELMAAHKLYTVTIHLDWRASDEELLAHFHQGLTRSPRGSSTGPRRSTRGSHWSACFRTSAK